MRKLIATGLFAVAVLLASAAANRPTIPEGPTDVLGDNIPSESIPEPITGDPVQPLPGSATEQKLPNEPYGIGPAEQAWKLEQLSPEERAAVERGRAYGAKRVGMNAAITAATKELSRRARAEAAQHQLGVDHLAEIGAVP